LCVNLAIGTGEKFYVNEVAQIKFKVNGKLMLWPFYILEDANNDVVLGLDWVRGYKVKISHCRDKVTVKLGSCRLEKKISYGMTTNIL